MIRCLAIDDEPLALQQLAAYIKKVPFLELAAQWPSAKVHWKPVSFWSKKRLTLFSATSTCPTLTGWIS